MTDAAIRLTAPNPLTSLQDAGRRGAMRYGVSASGPMDWVRFGQAIRLAGESAAFEIGMAGATFAAEGPVRLAVTGPGVQVRAGDRTVVPPALITLHDGERLTLSAGRRGMWAYVAVCGIRLGAPRLGSFATNVRTGLGARDLSRFACDAAREDTVSLFVDPLADSDPDAPIGVLPGPQNHMFSQAMTARFASATYTVTQGVDRMGYRLEGPPLEAERHDIVSDGIVEGAVQVPGEGHPIVQLADRAPTGGFPKIAVVARCDRPRLAQRRPGDAVRFTWIDRDAALARRRALRDAIASATPRSDGVDPLRLARCNLIDGVWAAADG